MRSARAQARSSADQGAREHALVVGAVALGESAEGAEQVGDSAPTSGQECGDRERSEAVVGRLGEGRRLRGQQRDRLRW